MKKFRRIFLVQSGILAILGIVLIVVGISMGGTKAVSNDLLNNRLAISLGDAFGSVDEAFDNMNSISSETNRFSKEDIKDLIIKGNAGEYEVIVWDESDYGIQGMKGSEHIKYLLEGSTLTIAAEEKKFIGWADTIEAKIYIPRDALLENVTLNIGAGKISCDGINANNLEVNIGAGEGKFNNIKAINGKFNVGAGDGEINNATFTECELKVGIGDIDLNGSISGVTDVDCGVGNVELKLTNLYADFNYAIKVGAGEVELGREKYSGVSNVVNLDNGSDNFMNIKCGLGDVSVEFEDRSN